MMQRVARVHQRQLITAALGLSVFCLLSVIFYLSFFVVTVWVLVSEGWLKGVISVSSGVGLS